MNPADYDYLTRYLQNRSGLALDSGKEYLLETRLLPLTQSWGISDFTELVQLLRNDDDQHLGEAVIDAMTTNETSFYRDKHPFEELKNMLLPAMITARQSQRQIRIWSAATSTGQEAYSIAMLIAEHFPDVAKKWRVDILGSDLSHNSLAQAKTGVYSQFEVQRGLPIQYLMKYFEQVERGWQINKSIRDMITFMPLNLIDDFQYLGPFDVVFCRNVLIYFNAASRKEILERIAKCMQPDGYLVLGAAETVLGMTDAFQRVKDLRSPIFTTTTPYAAIT